MLPALYPFLATAFDVTYVELGSLATIFFVVSCVTQMLSGFLVDRVGPRPVLVAALILLIVGAVGYALSTHYYMLTFFSVVSGLGNGVFHPVDFTIINRAIAPTRLGHAYSLHGISGNIGWAVAPAVLTPIVMRFGLRTALLVAATYPAVSLGIVVLAYKPLGTTRCCPDSAAQRGGGGVFGFLRVPAVWVCFLFFFLTAVALTAVQVYAPESVRELNALAVEDSAVAITTNMLCSAAGMFVGGFLAKSPSWAERVLAVGFVVAAAAAVAMAFAPMPPAGMFVLFGAMGIASGVAGPSRDVLVKNATPRNASGRVYGVVYSGLDIGQAVAPLLYSALLDRHLHVGILLALAAAQLSLAGIGAVVHRVPRIPVGLRVAAAGEEAGGGAAATATVAMDAMPRYGVLPDGDDGGVPATSAEGEEAKGRGVA